MGAGTLLLGTARIESGWLKMQIVMDEGVIKAELLRSALCWAAVPYIILGFVYIICAGYMVPFFNHPIASALMILVIALHKIGVLILKEMESRPWQAAVILIFYAPMLALPFLGPMFVPILISMGPV